MKMLPSSPASWTVNSGRTLEDILCLPLESLEDMKEYRRLAQCFSKLAGCSKTAFEVFLGFALEEKEISSKYVAADFSLPPPTRSRAVGALERSGLVETAVDPRDARRLLMRMTSRGEELLVLMSVDRVCSRRALADLDALRRCGLTIVQGSLLCALAVVGEANVASLSKMTGVARSTASLSLRKLTERGLVSPVLSPDARSVCYRASGRGALFPSGKPPYPSDV